MGTFTNSVRHGLANIVNFSGRDRPRLFWPYAGAVFGLNMIASTLMTVPLVLRVFEREMDRARRREYEPEAVDPAALTAEMIPDMEALLLPGMILTLIMAALLAAAVARRLHDRDRAGWWGLLPLPLMLVQFLLTPRMFEGMRNAAEGGGSFDASATLLLMANNLVYLAALGFLLYQLIMAGTRGPNRYGEDPIPPGERR